MSKIVLQLSSTFGSTKKKKGVVLLLIGVVLRSLLAVLRICKFSRITFISSNDVEG